MGGTDTLRLPTILILEQTSSAPQQPGPRAAVRTRRRDREPGVIANAEGPGGGPRHLPPGAGEGRREQSGPTSGQAASRRPRRPLGPEPRDPGGPGPAARQAHGEARGGTTRVAAEETPTRAPLPPRRHSLPPHRQTAAAALEFKSEEPALRCPGLARWRMASPGAASGDSRKPAAGRTPRAAGTRLVGGRRPGGPGHERRGGAWTPRRCTGRAFPPLPGRSAWERRAAVGPRRPRRSSRSAAGAD